MDPVVYSHRFDANEWYVIALIVLAFAPMFFLPRTFSPLQTAFNMMIGITFALIADHTFGVPPFDLYDVGDRSAYTGFDLFSYAMYAPFGYWLIYGYERFRMTGAMTILYIAVWTAAGLVIERAGVQVGMFHYKHGYRLLYSLPIYLFVISAHIGLYRAAFAPHRLRKRRLASE